jgi:hypothetical protein
MDWREVANRINEESKSIQLTPPDEVLMLFKHQIVPSGQGTGGQALSTMVLVAGDARALSYYIVLPLVRLIEDPSYTLDQLKSLFRELVPLSAEFQGSCGFTKLRYFVRDILGVLDTLETKDDFAEVVDALSIYTALLNGWVHHFFPWYAGELFPQRKAEDVKEMARLMNV